MSKKSEPATKEDVRQIVSEVVGEVASEILTVMAEKFGEVDSRLDSMEGRLDSMGASINRLENILRPTADKVDDHEVRLRRLESRPA
jgi:hypothetical protein